ncbi:hypothetical protein K490DRAFT_39291 [Saccharata proteae CBS 121410]|uniref:C3H1-type domain-containing protein n=1 Tax=Saccharata proteae CBS 121410 TaxID=1314787 RepID=A0A9P4HUY5_9PEZI|nr:hypothetical protein K490DRAFT_39291 [Saccharata proteae CBS 121410]
MASAFPPPFAPTNGANGNRIPQRHSRDFGGPHGSNGAIPGAPNGGGPAPGAPVPIHNRMGNGHGQHVRGMSGFDGPRSPPSTKSTSHVPCKFFRQGVCQAGKACPFLHSTEPATDTAPCKYFQKGNCKFGAKCALAHILPDGRTVNRPGGMGMGRHAFGARHGGPPPNTSLISMQAHMAGPGGPHPYPFAGPDDSYGPGKPYYEMIPTIDATFTSHPGSTYGSPPNDGRLPTSPIQKGLSVLDAPLPASFDSQGISHMARYGPIAASVPSRFGLESSPPSSYQSKPAESSALRNLHSSAFGNGVRNELASSPPVNEEPAGRRIMHSERFSKPKMMSASLGTRAPMGADDWDENFAFEEDLVPNSLHELLTPQEKMRRFSRAGDDDHSLNHRASLSGLGTPGDSSSKIGSPLASSPSRFGPLCSRTHKPNDEMSSSPGASVFGHVGSPLRNSAFNAGLSPSLRAISDRRPGSGDVSPFLSSPPRQASMSMISQQLQRTRLSSRASETAETASPLPGLTRLTSSERIGTAPGSTARPTLSGMDRAVSSSSIGRERIEEEEQGLFDMEEDEAKAGANKRYSGGAWGLPIGSKRERKEGSPWGNGT